MVNHISAEVQSVKQRYGIVGNSPQITSAIERALQVAPVELSVLIIGESGAGKEFFPQIIHSHSPRKHKTYIAVNCGAIPEGTIDSELFGHEKGAFTGAISDRKGYFEEANGGTIFLDEVAELPLTTQARLLRVLESGEYLRVGSSEVRKTDIRVVAATNKDMLRAVKEGRFREDLYYRLSTVQINVPPLRQRGNDIWLLTRKFSHDFADNYRMPAVEYTDDAKQAIVGFSWPGNVRQLKNVVEQISLFEAGKQVDRSVIMSYLPYDSQNMKPVVAGDAKSGDYSYSQERGLLFSVLTKMQKEIEDIQLALQQGYHPAGGKASSTALTHISSDVAELKRESRELVQYANLKHSAAMHDVDYDDADDQQPQVHEVEATQVEPVDVEASTVPPSPRTLEDTERHTIMQALERNMGRRKKTAQELNISERTLYRKIKEYGLDVPSSSQKS